MGLLDLFKRAPKEAEAAAGAAAEAVTASPAGAAAGATTAGAGAAAGATTAGAVAAAIGLAQAADWKAIGKLLGDAGEKLSGVMEKLQAAGLDDKLKSWIGQGANEPVSAEQVASALGGEEVASMAQDLGVSENEAATKIADVLPAIIDKLTPDGLVPDPKALADKLTGLLK